MKQQVILGCLLLAAASAFGQALPPGPVAARPPLSPALQDYFLRQVTDWDRDGGSLTDPRKIGVEMDFQSKVRPQLSQAGTAAAPIAPKIAELVATSEKNRYTLGYMLMGMTPTPAAAQLDEALQASSAAGGERLLAYARIGRSASPEGLKVLRSAAQSTDIPARVMATIALAYMGSGYPQEVAQTLGANLRDANKDVRMAAINGLRLVGPDARAAAPQVIDYLRTRENAFAAVRVLKNLPLALALPAKPDLEAVAADPKLSLMQKEDAVSLLLQMANEEAGTVLPQRLRDAEVIQQRTPGGAMVTEIRFAGNLQPNAELGCIPMEQVSSRFNPPALMQAARKCIASDDYNTAWALLTTANGFVYYDLKRLADRSTSGAGSVLKATVFGSLTDVQRDRFLRASQQNQSNPQLVKAYCGQLTKIGPPAYEPQWAIMHGLGVYQEPRQGHYLANVDAKALWEEVLSNRCTPTPSAGI